MLHTNLIIYTILYGKALPVDSLEYAQYIQQQPLNLLPLLVNSNMIKPVSQVVNSGTSQSPPHVFTFHFYLKKNNHNLLSLNLSPNHIDLVFKIFLNIFLLHSILISSLQVFVLLHPLLCIYLFIYLFLKSHYEAVTMPGTSDSHGSPLT